jgi:hypothetical protein
MTLGELKIAILKLLSNTNDDLTVENLAELESDDNYNTYLKNCRESINRAFTRLLTEKKIPYSTLYITPETAVSLRSGNTCRYRIKELANDVNTVIKVIYEDDFGNSYTQNQLRVEGEYIVLPKITKGIYILVYLPNVTIPMDMPDNAEINVPEHICNLIPYFVKADLYEEDEPNLAMASRNYFENAIAELKTNEDNERQSCVRSIFQLF